MIKTAILTKKINKNTGKKEWALVSKKDPSKILKWFGSKKPSEEEVLKQEKRIQYFKNIKSKVLVKLSSVKLYHSTHKKNLESILQKGLIPQVGEITNMGHGSNSDELVFFMDKPLRNLHGEDTVILELKNPKSYDIKKFDGNGLEDFNGGPYEEHIDIPIGVEMGDYFTYDPIYPEDLKVVK